CHWTAATTRQKWDPHATCHPSGSRVSPRGSHVSPRGAGVAIDKTVLSQFQTRDL
ncbi:hypothetical protein Tco_1436075, partial [Tanacetum coccineum]